MVIPPVPVSVPLKVVLPAVPLVRVPAPSEMVPIPVIDPTSSEFPARFKVAPAETLMAVLSEKTFEAPSVIVPEDTVVAPVYVFEPDSVRMPELECVSPPVPLMTPRNSVEVEPPTVRVALPRLT